MPSQITWNSRQIFLAMLGGLLGCSNQALSTVKAADVTSIQQGSDPTKIEQIQQAPRGSTVYLRGKVLHLAPLLGTIAYELQDASGHIWVTAPAPFPTVGEEVLIRGILRYQTIRLGNQEQGSIYIEQQEQMQRIPETKE
jgi:hypothetical protein